MFAEEASWQDLHDAFLLLTFCHHIELIDRSAIAKLVDAKEPSAPTAFHCLINTCTT